MDVNGQYLQFIAALRSSGLLVHLDRSCCEGVAGIEDEEYPLPSLEQVQDLFTRNQSLVETKVKQGFTWLQITPLGLPVLRMVDVIIALLAELGQRGSIYQAKDDPDEPDLPLKVNRKNPVWMWERLKPVMDTPAVVYFPKVYVQEDHGGMTKTEVLHDPRCCAFPGWSVGLVEPHARLPQPGQGIVLRGRKQLETYCTPQHYMEILHSPPYQGETGWTLEDFLVFFITRLVQTNQVSFDRQDSSGLWLLGAYVPDLPKTPNLVLAANWSRVLGQKLYLSSHRTGNHFQQLGARSMVRLGW